MKPKHLDRIIYRFLERTGLHLLFWFAYICGCLIIYSWIFKSGFSNILSQTLLMLPFILLSTYFLIYFGIPKLLNQRKIIAFAILFFVVPPFMMVLQKLLILIYQYFEYGRAINVRSFFTMGGLLAIFESYLMASIAVIIKILKQWYEDRHLKLFLEKQSLQTELELLRYQINPHFLFNVLNNLFSLAHKNKDDETASGIAKLSNMMRYMIYDSNAEKISLNKEIDHINNYIELQKIRFKEGYDIDIQFNIQGDPSLIMISPFLMIPFVENAFKYGISIQAKSFIHVNILINKNALEFTVVNSIINKNDSLDSGIGLKNVKKRLQLLYRDKHDLMVEEKNRIFNVKLTLALSNKKA